mmetsp:Transcript_21487/g.68637  ORF Transcript_21487/g.68637 Transcript_21487/m.68637 type:complete len:207 (+) Transcript_21487:1172-1792(+)
MDEAIVEGERISHGEGGRAVRQMARIVEDARVEVAASARVAAREELRRPQRVVEEIDQWHKERQAVRRQVVRLSKEKAAIAMPALRLGSRAIIYDTTPQFHAVVAKDGPHKRQPCGLCPQVGKLKWRVSERPIAHVVASKPPTANLIESPRMRKVDVAFKQLLVQLLHAPFNGCVACGNPLVGQHSLEDTDSSFPKQINCRFHIIQ